MGLSVKYVWPGITLLVIVAALLTYFVFPPTCERGEGEPHGSVNTPSASPSSTTPKMVLREPWERDYRIPTFAHPESYSVLLHPDLTSGLFSGKVGILVNVTASAPYLLVHIEGLTVTSTQLSTVSGEVVTLSRSLKYGTNQFWVVVPDRELTVGLYLLQLQFSGDMKRDIVGLYMSTYTDAATGRHSEPQD